MTLDRFQTSRVGVVLAWCALTCLLLQPAGVLAQSAAGDRIAPGDVLRLLVPERPELEQSLTVDAGGAVSIAQVGEVDVAGLTLNEASELVKQRIRLIYPTLDTVSLEATTGDRIRIYVLGEAVSAGMVSFENIPTVWDVVRSAGGPTLDADLRGARIIREGEDGPSVRTVDLSGLMDGEVAESFELRDGDTLVIPRQTATGAGLGPDEGVRVFGSVSTPSTIDIEGPTPLMDVLMMAGAPTPDADLKKIRWVRREGGVPRAELVDLDAYMSLADPAGNPLVEPGDTIEVAFRQSNWMQRNLPFILGTVTAMATVYLAYNQATE